MAPLLLTTRRQPAATSPACGAPGPFEVALSLLVHRTFPFRPASIGVAADWLGLHRPALAGSAAAVAAGRQISRQRVQTVLGGLQAAATGMPPPPALLRALALLDSGPPAQPAADAAHSLQSAGLAVGDLHPAAVLAAARLFHLDHGVALRGPRPGTTVVTADHLPAHDQAYNRLRTTARRRGLIHRRSPAGTGQRRGTTLRPVEVSVAAYSQEWPERFEFERARLTVALRPWLSAEVQHVGSTAVAGLAAKPIIDMVAGVRDLEEARHAIDVLAQHDYSHADHRPHEALWFFKPAHSQYAERTYHLHLTEVGSDLWRERLGFRDALRADPSLASRYQTLKRRLADCHETVAEYTQGKRAFVLEVLSGL